MKEKITFTEELAQKIIADNNLPLSNLAKWRLRGNIPAQYFEEKSEEIKTNDSLYPKILEILTYKEIAPTKFRTFNKRPQRAADLINKRYRMTEAEKLLFMTEVSEIRNLLMKAYKVFDEKNIKAIIKEMRIHHTHIFAQRLISQIHQDIFNINSFDKNEISAMKEKMIILYNRLLLQ